MAIESSSKLKHTYSNFNTVSEGMTYNLCEEKGLRSDKNIEGIIVFFNCHNFVIG